MKKTIKNIFKTFLVCLLGYVLFFYGCNIISGELAFFENIYRGDPPVPATCKIVMEPNSRITATTSAGTISITSGNGLKRYYSWDGVTRAVVMDPDYYGAGINYPGPGYHWWPHQGISRGVLGEEQKDFKTIDDALKWLSELTWIPHVYRDDGLVVGWDKNPSRSQLNVNVWQIYINGKRPIKMLGSQNDKIIVTKIGEKEKG